MTTDTRIAAPAAATGLVAITFELRAATDLVLNVWTQPDQLARLQATPGCSVTFTNLDGRPVAWPCWTVWKPNWERISWLGRAREV